MTAISKRAETAVEMDSDVNWTGEQTAEVDSESSDKTYEVDLEARTCTCPDHVFRGTTCKHLYKAANDSDLISLSQ